MSNDIAIKILSDHGVDVINNVVHIVGDISEETYDKLVLDVSLLNLYNDNYVDKLTVYLSTYGGDLYYGFAMYDFLKKFDSKIKIICSGPVMSAGTIILQAADTRAMLPNSHLLVHFGMEINDNQQTKHQHEQLHREIKNLLIQNCTAKEQTVKKWFSKESYFDTKRALSVGLVDEVINHE